MPSRCPSDVRRLGESICFFMTGGIEAGRTVENVFGLSTRKNTQAAKKGVDFRTGSARRSWIRLVGSRVEEFKGSSSDYSTLRPFALSTSPHGVRVRVLRGEIPLDQLLEVTKPTKERPSPLVRWSGKYNHRPCRQLSRRPNLHDSSHLK